MCFHVISERSPDIAQGLGCRCGGCSEALQRAERGRGLARHKHLGKGCQQGRRPGTRSTPELRSLVLAGVLLEAGRGLSVEGFWGLWAVMEMCCIFIDYSGI